MLPPQSPSMPFGFSMCGALASYPLFFDFSLVFVLLYFSIRSVLCLIVYLSSDDIFCAVFGSLN
jgi:hypothetical protein